jgi:hypothetical protein
LDIDLAVESIDHPERFPLVSKIGVEQTKGQAQHLKAAESLTKER